MLKCLKIKTFRFIYKIKNWKLKNLYSTYIFNLSFIAFI